MKSTGVFIPIYYITILKYFKSETITTIVFLGAILLASVMNLVAISYDRLNAIVLPQERRLTIFSAKIIMVVAWVLGIVFATPLCIYRTYKVSQVVFNIKTNIITLLTHKLI